MFNQFKNNKFVLIYISSILILVLILMSSIPFFNILKKFTSYDNDFVKNQVIINPDAKSPKVIDRVMNVQFIAEVDNSINWKFNSLQKNLKIKVGQNNIIKYEGKNLSNKTITVTADFFALPDIILPYLIKTECFCFKEQTLKPGESQIFTMVFFLDPSLDLDKELDDITDLVFTYSLTEYTS